MLVTGISHGFLVSITCKSLGFIIGELRSMVDQDLITYPYSTREVVNMVKHLDIWIVGFVIGITCWSHGLLVRITCCIWALYGKKCDGITQI